VVLVPLLLVGRLVVLRVPRRVVVLVTRRVRKVLLLRRVLVTGRPAPSCPSKRPLPLVCSGCTLASTGGPGLARGQCCLCGLWGKGGLALRLAITNTTPGLVAAIHGAAARRRGLSACGEIAALWRRCAGGAVPLPRRAHVRLVLRTIGVVRRAAAVQARRCCRRTRGGPWHAALEPLVWLARLLDAAGGEGRLAARGVCCRAHISSSPCSSTGELAAAAAAAGLHGPAGRSRGRERAGRHQAYSSVPMVCCGSQQKGHKGGLCAVARSKASSPGQQRRAR
jgi:hypothetical protein